MSNFFSRFHLLLGPFYVKDVAGVVRRHLFSGVCDAQGSELRRTVMSLALKLQVCTFFEVLACWSGLSRTQNSLYEIPNLSRTPVTPSFEPVRVSDAAK